MDWLGFTARSPSRANSQATGAGFGNCEMIDSSVELNDSGSYDAFVTLSCVRL